MNREQKIALTIVITFSLGLLIEIAVIVMRCFITGIPKMAFVFPIFIAGSGGIITLIFFRKPDTGPITSDERDKLFSRNADLAGFGAVFLVVILVSIIPPMIDANAKIPTTCFPYLLIGAGFCYVYARSIAILIQYWSGGKGGE
jgi:hypothetical protein